MNDNTSLTAVLPWVDQLVPDPLVIPVAMEVLKVLHQNTVDVRNP